MMTEKKYLGDSNLTAEQVRARLKLALYVQRGLLHDPDSYERHEALAQCGTELVYLSTLLTYAEHQDYDDDVELGLRLAAIEADNWDEQNEMFAYRHERDLYLEITRADEPSNDDLRMPKNIKKLGDNLLPGDDMLSDLPDLTTMDEPNADADDDLYDGWIWDESSQGFVNKGTWDDEDDKSSYDDSDNKDNKDHDNKKNND